MTPGFKGVWLSYGIGLLWFFAILWPLTGIHADGSLTFAGPLGVVLKVGVAGAVLLAGYQLNAQGRLAWANAGMDGLRAAAGRVAGALPQWAWIGLLLLAALVYPFMADRYGQDVAASVMVYICLGLGLNIVVGLAGLLDLGYIAFYGVGAYTYGLLSIHFGLSFWLALPLCAAFAAIAGCIVGYPTLRMRGDYLAIVTLGFGEIIRIVLNNWMSLTNGPNGILGIKPPMVPVLGESGLEMFPLRSIQWLYYVILGLTVLTVIAVHRLNFSRVGRAWEAIREDETAAELTGINTFMYKLLAYAMGAVFGGLAGGFFAARMRFISPESFTFMESVMVLAMVVLGGMGSIPGIILGALALIGLPEVFREFELYRMLVFGGAMVVMMLLRPAGLWPASRMGKRSEEAE